jgi:ribose-phosphate pyrophosphokinase
LRIIAGPTSAGLSRKVAELLHARIVDVEARSFPDGESYVRLTAPVRGEEVAVIQTLSRPQDTSAMQLLQVMWAARDCGATKIIAVTPYFAYARQHRPFLEGEASSAVMLAKLIQEIGAGAFMTVDAHKADSLKGFTIPAANIDASPIISEKLREMQLQEASVVAPDEGALNRARSLAGLLDGDAFYMRKSWDRLTGKISTADVDFDISGKNVIIFDDVISTGGTVVEGIKILRGHHPARIVVACVHALMGGDVLDKIFVAGAEEVITTDTLPTTLKAASVAPLIAEELSRSA